MDISNVVTLESRDLSDAPDAGGRASGRVFDGTIVNRLFPKISKPEATRGAWRVSKLFMALKTATADKLYGSHVILSSIPADPQVSAVLFTTKSHTDVRADARDWVESYVIAGIESRWKLMDRHLTGLRMLQLWGDPSAPLPEIGEVLCLIDEAPGATDKQFVRVTSVESRLQSFFSQECGEFEMRIAQVELGDELIHEFMGSTPSCKTPSSTVKVRRTMEAAAASYYGTSPLAQAATAGSTTVYAQNIRVPLAPSAQREQALIDVLALAARDQVIQAGPAEVSTARWWGPPDTSALQIPTAAVPGSIKIYQFNGYGYGGLWASDNGDGTCTGQYNASATVDYGAGRILIDNPVSTQWYWQVTWIPAAVRNDPSMTAATEIDAAHRGYTYIKTLNPVPAQGTVVVQYRSMGRWYELTDMGDGTLGGDGVGTVDYGTGSTSVTLAQLPDSNTKLLWSWCTSDGYVQRTGHIAGGHIYLQLPDAGHVAESAIVRWVAGGVDKSVTEQADGTWAGDGVGSITSVGIIDLIPDQLPDGEMVMEYMVTGDPSVRTATVADPAVEFLANENTSDRAVEGSLLITIGDDQYVGRQGHLYRNPSLDGTDGEYAGDADYQTWNVRITLWEGGIANDFSVVSLLTEIEPSVIGAIHTRAPAAPIRPSGLSITATSFQDEQLFASANDLGEFSGAATGTIDYDTGAYSIAFSSPVFASSVRVNCVSYSYVPQDASLIGINPVRLPIDGRVRIFKRGDLAVIFDVDTADAASLTAGQVIDSGRVNLAYVKVVDANGVPLTVGTVVNPVGGEHFLYDDLSGQFQVPAGADLSAFTAPYQIEYQYEDMAVITDLEIDGRLELSAPLGNAYGTTAKVASALQFGDMGADVRHLHDLRTWSNSWEDDPAGDSATGTYNDGAFPIEVVNDGAIEERWSISFTSATIVRVIGETVGVIAEGIDITTETIAPINPETGTPYFTIQPDGWGAGWAAGNALRFNTIAGQAPFYVSRTTTPGALVQRSDGIHWQCRGNGS